ncbi:Threonine/homoserine/homoserine lactone efflux protein [Collimonas sp. OK307]|uniref:LysE family translocator n=1 Tax=Collimonas sp. OK307 TaxID=1801620 RepID=UPI0008E4625B|nr:LysE family translocator [Collimonas sp. OK307]SFI13051.1 Threonine/homoserine/homoserine lactone efflux protein [Collimonas sp. OK307]
MNTQTVLTFTAFAALSILSPGPSILLSLRNGATYGPRSVMWSGLGNISGVFCLSTAAILGLGVLLKSSAMLFFAVKICGALYLFYIGIRHLFAGSTGLAYESETGQAGIAPPPPRKLYGEAFLTAATNPKAVLFFTALFPQFINAQAPLLSQFLILMAIFMSLSYATHLSYARIASRARHLLLKPVFAKWVNRVVGAAFISFGSLLLALRRQTS